MTETLPPFPGAEKKQKVRQFIGFILAGREWIEVGYGTRHDGKGIEFELTIGQPDGTKIHIREIGPDGYFQQQHSPRRKRWRSARPRA